MVRRRIALLLLFLAVGAGWLGFSAPDAEQKALDVTSQAVIRSVHCDEAGNCWFATWGGIGLHTTTGDYVAFTPDNSGLAHDYCHDVAVDAAGMIWIGHHYTGGISLLDIRGTPTDRSDDRWLQFDEADGLAANHSWVEDVYVDSANRKWFGHAGGVSVLDDGGTPFDKADDTWTHYNPQNSTVAQSFANAVLEDEEGCVWVGTDDNLSRLCGDTWQEQTWLGVTGCLECCWTWPGWVWDLDLDADGHLWVADGRCGAARWDGSSWTICDTRDPACRLPPSPASGSDLGTRVAALDAAGNMWFGTRGRGVGRYDGSGTWTTYTMEDTDWLTNDWVEGLDFDTAGHGWFGTWGSGVAEYVPPTSNSGVVTPEDGGSVSSPDGLAHIVLPKGAVDSPTLVTVAAATPPPTDLHVAACFAISAVISATTTPVTGFHVPYTLTIGYGGAPAMPGTRSIYYWTGSAWLLEPTSMVDTAHRLVTATPDHMTIFAVLGEVERVYVPSILHR